MQRRDDRGRRRLMYQGTNIYDDLMLELRLADNTARIAALEFGRAVDGAAQDLETYARPKADRLREAEESPGAMLRTLASIVPPLLPSRLALKTGMKFFDDVGANVVSHVRGILRRSVTEAVRLGTGSKAIEAAIGILPKNSRDLVDAMPDTVKELFTDQIDKAIETGTGGWDAETAQFLSPFIDALGASDGGRLPPSTVNQIIEDAVGLPVPSRAVEFRLQLYEAWVGAIEEIVTRAEFSTQAHIYDFISEREGGGSPRRRIASARARNEAERRRREIRAGRR